MTFEEIYSIDASNMYTLIREFPSQILEATTIGRSASIRINSRAIDKIVLCGLGGSAIGGDLLRSYLEEREEP